MLPVDLRDRCVASHFSVNLTRRSEQFSYCFRNKVLSRHVLAVLASGNTGNCRDRSDSGLAASPPREAAAMIPGEEQTKEQNEQRGSFL